MSHFTVIHSLHPTILFVWIQKISLIQAQFTQRQWKLSCFKEEKVSDHLGISWAYKVLNKQLNSKDKFTQQKLSCCSLFVLCTHGLAGCSQEGLAHMLVDEFYLKLVIFQINCDHANTVSSKWGTITTLFPWTEW